MMTPKLRKRKRLLQTILLSLILFVLVFFFFSLFRFLIFRFFDFQLVSDDVRVLLASVVLAVLFYKPLDYLLFLFLKDDFFQGSSYDFSTLAQIARSSHGLLSTKEIANLIVNTFVETWNVPCASVFVFNRQNTKTYQIASAFGFKSNNWKALELKEGNVLVELLKVRKFPIDRERVTKSFSWQEANQLTHEFERLEAQLVVPVFFQGHLIGMINLNWQQATHRLHQNVLKSFSEFSDEIGPTLHGALEYEKIEADYEALVRMRSDFLYRAQHLAIAELAVGLAHEIHNPLTVISGKAQVLLLKRDQLAYDEYVEDVLKTIVKQTKRAADITRKLLMFSDARDSVTEPIDFESLINDTVALLSYQVSLEQIQVVKRFAKTLPKWVGNMTKLREAFLNLFLNAVQAIGAKGLIQVSTQYKKEDDLIEIQILDSGDGIREEDLAKVFQPFFTTREGATGLGLFVTQQIICSYRGTIRAERNRDRGTSFVIELPCEQTFKSVQVTSQKEIPVSSGDLDESGDISNPTVGDSGVEVGPNFF